MTFLITSHYPPLQNSGPCNSVNCLGHFKNVYDDDDDDGRPSVLAIVAMLMQALKRCPGHSVGAGGLVMHVRPELLVLHTEHCMPFEPANNRIALQFH